MSVASDISARLARNAEAVCRHYLGAGRREGRYWLVGDVAGSQGRSLYVRLSGAERRRGAAGNWTDAATGDHGDLLDLIALNRQLTIADAIAEARRFLALPRPDDGHDRAVPAKQGSPHAARRLWAMSRPIRSTLAEAYFNQRRIRLPRSCRSLRFHPHCWYRPAHDDPPGTPTAWPALIAAVTDPAGQLTGLHRTWLDPAGGKAPVAHPRRALGLLLGSSVRLSAATDILAAGEGIETMLSLTTALPALPACAGLSANHLAAIEWPHGLQRLYVASDADRSGQCALATLRERGAAAGIDVRPLEPCRGDFNEDLVHDGAGALRRALLRQLEPSDAARLKSIA